MAKATPIETRVVTSVTLELTIAEAQTLQDLLDWCVGGDPHESRRRFIDGIHEALRSAGISLQPDRPSDIRGDVRFV